MSNVQCRMSKFQLVWYLQSAVGSHNHCSHLRPSFISFRQAGMTGIRPKQPINTFVSLFMRQRILALILLFSIQAYSQDTMVLRVHFLYGSKPLKEFKSTERKWFG